MLWIIITTTGQSLKLRLLDLMQVTFCWCEASLFAIMSRGRHRRFPSLTKWIIQMSRNVPTLYFSPLVEQATRWVTLVLKSFRIVPPIWWTKFTSFLWKQKEDKNMRRETWRLIPGMFGGWNGSHHLLLVPEASEAQRQGQHGRAVNGTAWEMEGLQKIKGKIQLMKPLN